MKKLLFPILISMLMVTSLKAERKEENPFPEGFFTELTINPSFGRAYGTINTTLLVSATQANIDNFHTSEIHNKMGTGYHTGFTCGWAKKRYSVGAIIQYTEICSTVMEIDEDGEGYVEAHPSSACPSIDIGILFTLKGHRRKVLDNAQLFPYIDFIVGASVQHNDPLRLALAKIENGLPTAPTARNTLLLFPSLFFASNVGVHLYKNESLFVKIGANITTYLETTWSNTNTVRGGYTKRFTFGPIVSLGAQF
jgi:hypothetical protein